MRKKNEIMMLHNEQTTAYKMYLQSLFYFENQRETKECT